METPGSSVRFSGNVCGGLRTHGSLTFRTAGTAVVIASPTTEYTLVAKNGRVRIIETFNGVAKVSCLDDFKNGILLAMGTATTIGVPADIYVWDVPQRKLQQTLSLHKGRVQALSFTCCGTLLVSVGGPDDCSLVVWDVKKGEALCGAPILATDVRCFHNDAQRFATCGSDSALYIWQLDATTHKLFRSDIQLGQYKRNFTRLQVTKDDKSLFVGSTTGDIAQISTQSMHLVRKGPKPQEALSSVDALCCESDSIILAAGSEGRIIALGCCARSPDFGKSRSKRKAAKSADILLVVAEHRLPKGVTSLCPSTAPGMPVTAGTRNGDIFQLTMIRQGTFVQERVYSAPCGQVHDLAMPHQCSDLVASCSHEEIRLWDTRRHLELLRIGLPSIDCLCLTIPKDGSSLVAGCSDGTVRFYGPETGQLKRVLEGAHQTAVHAVAMSLDGKRLYSGDASGFFKVWQLGPQSHAMLAALKEHKGAIHRIVLALDDKEGTTACSDGSCILWDLQTHKRRCILAAGTSIADACYSSDQSQLVTAGANRKLAYWDCHTGEAIRELEASQTGPVFCVAVHPDGHILASGGGDKEVKLWLYNEGTCFATMTQHTGEVTTCMFTADGQTLISADSHGALCFWDMADAVGHAEKLQSSGMVPTNRLA